jgi:hypothetical protein
MNNGFEINIRESDFKAKEPAEQSWILFQGITSINRCINGINEKGCDYGRKKYRERFIKLWGAIAGGITVGLGIVYVIYQMTCK